MGITQHTTGVDNVKSTANLQMLTGNVGRVGGGVNALRGQNNVQGACDMGALPNVYSGYQNVTLEPMIQKMKDAWGCDVAGGKVGYTVTDMINVLCDNPPKLKCIYIMGENPMVSDPDLGHVEHALKNLEFLVVQDIFLTETAQLADVVLPAACYAEKDGTQTSTERRVQRFRKAVEPPGEAKADWQIICELGTKMGFGKQFGFKNPEEIFNEVASRRLRHELQAAEAGAAAMPDGGHPGTPILHGKIAIPTASESSQSSSSYLQGPGRRNPMIHPADASAMARRS
jgi:formate dehydrogenase major subunit